MYFGGANCCWWLRIHWTLLETLFILFTNGGANRRRSQREKWRWHTLYADSYGAFYFCGVVLDSSSELLLLPSNSYRDLSIVAHLSNSVTIMEPLCVCGRPMSENSDCTIMTSEWRRLPFVVRRILLSLHYFRPSVFLQIIRHDRGILSS